MRTEIKALFTGVALSWAVLLAGCPGKLLNPERFKDGGAAGGGSNIDCPDVPTEIFAKKCAGSSCHSGMTPASNLDLVADGVASRVVGKAAVACKGSLADPASPEASVIYIKVAPGDMCGSRMPLGNSLSDEEIACVKSWIGEQMPAATSTSTSTGAGGAGGAGGAASSSSGT